MERERDAKKALQSEKERLELEIKQMKRDRERDSSRHDDSQSVYFAKSQFQSPRNHLKS